MSTITPEKRALTQKDIETLHRFCGWSQNMDDELYSSLSDEVRHMVNKALLLLPAALDDLQTAENEAHIWKMACAELKEQLARKGTVPCLHCDFASGQRGNDRCPKCDGTGRVSAVLLVAEERDMLQKQLAQARERVKKLEILVDAVKTFYEAIKQFIRKADDHVG